MATLKLAIDAREASKGATEFKQATTSVTASAQSMAKDTKEAAKAINDVGTETAKAGKKVKEEATRMERELMAVRVAAEGLRRSLSTLFLGVGLAQTVRSAISSMAGFEKVMSEVRGVAVDSSAPLRQQKIQFEELRMAARELGTETRYSATEAARSLLLLAKAGLTTQQAIDSVKNTLNLAAATGLDLERSTDIMIATMSQFGIAAKDSARATDVLIKAANESIINVDQLAESLKVVGPVASAIGLSLEDTAAAVQVLGDAGINASAAGTQFRSILVNLVAPVEKARDELRKLGLTHDEVNPEKVGLVQALKNLRGAHLDTEAAVQIADRRNSAAIITLLSFIEKLENLADANRNARGEGERLATFMNDNLATAFQRLSNMMQEAWIKSGDKGLLGFFRDSVDGIRVMIAAIAGVDSGLESMQIAFINLKRLGSTAWEALVYGLNLLWDTVQSVGGQIWLFFEQGFINIQRKAGEAFKSVGEVVRDYANTELGVSIIGEAEALLSKAKAAQVALDAEPKTTLADRIAESKQEHLRRMGEIEGNAAAELDSLDKTHKAIEAERKRKAEQRQANIKEQAAADRKALLEGAIAGERIEQELGFDPTEEAGRHLLEVLEKMEAEANAINLTNNERERAMALHEIERVARRAEVEDIEKVTDAYMKNFERVQASRDRRKFTEGIDDMVDKMKAEASTLGMTNNERERALVLMELTREARKNEIKDIEELTDKVDAHLKKLQKSRELIKLGDDIGRAFQNAFTDLGTEIEDLAEAVDDVVGLLKQLGQIVFDTLVSKPLGEGISSLVQGIAKAAGGGAPASNTQSAGPQPVRVEGVSGFAALDRGGIMIGRTHIPTHDQGTMVHQPTMVATSTGGAMIGERRPEAVLPLARNAHGDLGVRSIGSSGPQRQTTVNMTVLTKDVDSFRRSKRQVASQVAREINR